MWKWTLNNKIGLALMLVAVGIAVYGYTIQQIPPIPSITQDSRVRGFTVYAISTSDFSFRFTEGDNSKLSITQRATQTTANFSLRGIPAQNLSLFIQQYWTTANSEQVPHPEQCKYLYLYLNTNQLKQSRAATTELPLERLTCRAQLIDANQLESLPINED